MKKLIKNRLVLDKEIVRVLERKHLAGVAGGITGLVCDTETCIACHRSGGICGGNSDYCTSNC